VKILRVFDRRPLSDAFTTLLGGKVPGGAGDVRADGLAVLRRRLEAEIAALDVATDRLGSALGNVTGQQAVLGKDREALMADLEQWKEDVEAAEKTRAAFEARLGRLSGSLAGTVEAIGRLGRELSAGVGRLTAEVDRRAPAPDRGGSLPAAGRTR
jgi:outer membrane murein-binding lipoprotein Lpp